MSHALQDWLVVVPARLKAVRLPNKPLLDLGGKPMVVRVYENLQPLREAGATVLVATDSEAIYAACEKAGCAVEMTDEAHPTGTDRIREVAMRFSHPYCLNVQGDEPFVVTSDLIRLMTAFSATPAAHMGTLYHTSSDMEAFATPAVVKVVCDLEGYGLYFSRSPLPYPRVGTLATFRHHLGVYSFRRESLIRYGTLAPTFLEKTESLEQLRALENGMKILCIEADFPSRGIDTQEDLDAARLKF